ncbi:sentrin-specific protease 8 [Ditylenchus destructor]|uniref:Sentrin-specific protease 8 n=1 Tax=Ditylenchus destructor TaxID=166010 RepID=A0AAD4RDU6_9BILA|nr:sentrin-specific protease 8 [Ditylenchus destructor]
MDQTVSSTNKVLVYDDIVLFGADVNSLLARAGWLTDSVICIVYASICELIKYCDENEDNSALFKDVGLSPEKWCFFILNDNADPNVAYGGSHWCLLLFDPIKQSFLLFDSMPGSDYGGVKSDIISFARKLMKFLCCKAELLVEAVRCPKMSISGDCGMFVIEYMRAILIALEKNIRLDSYKIDLSHINDEFILSQRQTWWFLIKNLKTTGNKEQYHER